MRHTSEERERLIKEYQESGIPAKAWSTGKGIAYSTFRGWLRSAEQDPITGVVGAEQPEQPVVWAEMKPLSNFPEDATAYSRKSQITLSRAGWAISIENSFDAELLAEVMKVVTRVCC